MLKSAGLTKIKNAISDACNKKAFICSHVKDMLSLAGEGYDAEEENLLTITEKEILRELAWGKTAKEIAATRNISVYTVTTHRKNIYRKLAVNNAPEASRYALRAGIIDTSDYYI